MTQRWKRLIRRMAPALTMGFLVQAGGCSMSANSSLKTLVTTIADNLVSSFVFGAFNVPTRF